MRRELLCECVAFKAPLTHVGVLWGAHLGKQHLAVLVMHGQAGIHVQGQLPGPRQLTPAGQALQMGGQGAAIPRPTLLVQPQHHLPTEFCIDVLFSSLP